ncbi:MAG: neutral zinc metallopeptidase, partial [Planctomycetota bacterium]
MRLDNQAASDNIEDRRGGGRGRMIAGLGGGGGIIAVILMLLVNFLGGNPGAQQNAAGPNNVGFQRPDAVAPGAELTPEEKQQGEFCAKVLGSTETVWGDIFSANRLRYKEPKLVLFSGSTMSGCGGASANSGPFYCPADEKVYLDTMFFVQLERQFRAPGDFARAYVIAHEVGHHVQNLIG